MEWASEFVTNPAVNATVESVCEACKDCDSTFKTLIQTAVAACFMFYVFFK